MDMVKNNPKEAMRRLSTVWAAIPKDDSGVSYYAGVGNNKAHLTPEQMYSVFQRLKMGGTVRGTAMQPVMVESGEKIFSPGSYGPEIQSLNESVPRFQTGGSVNVSSMTNPIHNIFQQANKKKVDSDSFGNKPIVVPVPQPVPSSYGRRNGE